MTAQARSNLRFPTGQPAPDAGTAHVGGIPVSTLSLAQLISKMIVEAPSIRKSGTSPKLVFDCNGHALSLADTDAAYRRDLLAADLVHADGQVIVKASHLFGRVPIADRSSTTDMFIDSLKPAAASNVRYFLFGGREDVNAACSDKIVGQTPGLTLAGRRNGYFGPDEENAIVEEINASGTDVLWVGLGKPREQAFCVRHRDRLRTGWIVTCGGLFNYITGDYPRAPQWMQDKGLEWLHRMATNPRHLAWRYLTTNPHALWLIWKHRNG
jgi:N-acetylglucosaminyldiphosphoundecaprenol N-acetyl-beta-D-mannosaminyltransferase